MEMVAAVQRLQGSERLYLSNLFLERSPSKSNFQVNLKKNIEYIKRTLR